MVGASGIWSYRAAWLYAAIALGWPLSPPHASGQTLAEITASWQENAIVVAVDEHLSQKQQEMISGGFTTLSDFSGFEGYRDGAPEKLILSRRCQIKFDAWEETFRILVLEESSQDNPKPPSTSYQAACLRLTIADPGTVARLRQRGAFIVRLAVKQTSEAEAESIKEWLVKQQSGVIQTLFSHMLGELSLNESVTFLVRVPEPPASPNIRESKQKPRPASPPAKEQGKG